MGELLHEWYEFVILIAQFEYLQDDKVYGQYMESCKNVWFDHCYLMFQLFYQRVGPNIVKALILLTNFLFFRTFWLHFKTHLCIIKTILWSEMKNWSVVNEFSGELGPKFYSEMKMYRRGTALSFSMNH